MSALPLWQALLFVAAGSVPGAVLGYLSNIVALKLWGARFPWATLTVNVVGCFLAGMVLALALRGQLSESSRLFWMVGFLGALTTFSAFSAETLGLLQAAHYFTAGLNIGLNVVLSLVAVVFGHWLLRETL